MRYHFPRRGLAALLGAAFLAVPFTLSGQTPEPLKLSPDLVAPAVDPKAPIRTVSATGSTEKGPSTWDRLKTDPNLSPVSKQLLPVFHRGAEFLTRMQQPNGRFVNGWVTGLHRPLEGDHFLRQAMATFALCRVARFTGEEKYAVRARQSVLALLSETTTDAAHPGVRHTVHAPMTCDRLAGVGCLLMAVCELPDPTADMLAKGEELVEYLRLQQKADGSLSVDGIESAPEFVGMALYGMALSHQTKPSSAKLDTLKKAASFYRPQFQKQPSMAAVPWMTAAFACAFERSKETGFAEAVLEMNDWICQYQFDKDDPLHPDWRGGYQQFDKGKVIRQTPDLSATLYCQSLADATRVLRKLPKPDLERFERYKTTLQRGLQFVAGLQFSRDTTLHLSPKVGEALAGGFHVSSQDGNIRIEQSAWAVSALVQYFGSGAERE